MSELTKHHRKSYGPIYNKFEPRADLCASATLAGFEAMQCSNKRHPDTLDGAFCKAHCPERKKARQEKREAARRAEGAKLRAYHKKRARRSELKDEAVSILKGFAAFGTGTVGEISREWLAKWKDAQ